MKQDDPSFAVPSEWINKKVAISYAFPIVSPGKLGGGGVNYPITEGVLLRDLVTSVLIQDANASVGQVLIPKGRIWNIVCRESATEKPPAPTTGILSA